MNRYALVLCLSIGSALAFPGSHAKVDADAEGPFDSSVGDLNPLELARRVRSVGDDTVLRVIASEGAEVPRTRAIRGAVHMRSPVDALPVLVPVAAGRHPFLAPAAAHAAEQIASATTLADLANFEVLPSTLGPVVDAYQVVADDESARPDVRALCRRVSADLRLLAEGPPEPE